jgi:hypothetical protein
MKGNDFSSRPPKPELLKVARGIELLKRIGFPDQAIAAMVEEKIRCDVASENARRDYASRN